MPSGMILRATGNVTINGTISVQFGAQTGASASAGVAMAAAGLPNGGIGLNGTQATMLPLGVLGAGPGRATPSLPAAAPGAGWWLS
ncbi:hypothetical protein [Hymenobacter sp. BRD67]|uniref:hypothetical protein n=1 Tax=Hymenobacter sp. BRD67 TaxID=2675877 RepID=UPI0015670F94|nr:hypothetical protein [Hymenobacter sp. BRD67]QKG52997.1 hypothetical protein GKZ67_10770 [Hymenobacter sp. BRD67]